MPCLNVTIPNIIETVAFDKRMYVCDLQSTHYDIVVESHDQKL